MRCAIACALAAAAALSAIHPLARAEERSAHLRYLDLVKKERASRSPEAAIHNGIAGGLAVLIGSYGVYFGNNSPMTSVIYSLTQSAGVAAIGHAYYSYNTVGLMERQIRFFERRPEMSVEAFERLAVFSDEQRRRIGTRSLAATSGVLALINAIDGYRSRKRIAVRNLLWFASFNLALVGAASGYAAYKDDFSKADPEGDAMDLALAPLPRFTYRF